MIVDWETCDVRMTCNWCNQLLNMLGMCNLKSRAIFWTQGRHYLKKVKNTSVEYMIQYIGCWIEIIN